MISTMLLASLALAQAGQADDMAIVGGTVIDGTGGPVIEDGVVLVEGDRLSCVGDRTSCPLPDGAEIVDATGAFLTPGLVDAHVHFAQTGWLDGRPDGLYAGDVYPYDETVAQLRGDPGRWHRSWLCTGITAVFDVGGQAWTVEGEQSVDTDRADRVHVAAAGPLTTHAGRNDAFLQGGAADQPVFLDMVDEAGVQANVDAILAMGGDALKIWYLAPRDEDRERLDALLMRAGEMADEAGLPMIVHATSLREAKLALRAGAFMLVHSVDDQPVDQEFLDLLIETDAVYVPTIFAGPNWGRALSSVALERAAPVDDPGQCVDADLRERIAHPERFAAVRPAGLTPGWAYGRLEDNGADIALMQANLRAVHEAGGQIATGTDSGNPMTLHGPSIYREMEAMQAAGIPAADVVAMSTSGGAYAMGGEADFGRLAAGLSADLLILAEDPREDVAAFRSLTHVMRRGVLRSQAELQVFTPEE